MSLNPDELAAALQSEQLSLDLESGAALSDIEQVFDRLQEGEIVTLSSETAQSRSKIESVRTQLKRLCRRYHEERTVVIKNGQVWLEQKAASGRFIL